MSEKGWICLNRKITEHWLWQDKPFSKGQAWLDLLLRASHKGTKFLLGNELISLEPGQFITSEVKLSEAWGWSKHKTREFLLLLESDQMIVRKADHKKTAITIVKWGLYQNLSTTKDTTEGPLRDYSGTTEGPLRDTINNINNINNENNENNAADAAMQRQQQQLSEEVVTKAIRIWNSQSCTQNISTIKGKRLFNMELCCGEKPERFLAVIGSIDKQEFLRNMGRPITFDWFCQPENFEKVADGNYKESYSRGGGISGLKRDWEIV